MILEYHFESGNFDPYGYEISDQDLKRALIKLLPQADLAVCQETDAYDTYGKRWEDELVEYFKDDAYEEYLDTKQLATDPDSYYGVSRRD